MPDYNKIRLICFDLDDTLWPCMPVIMKAEQTLYQWLCVHQPEITGHYTQQQLRQKRLALAQQRADIKHDLTALRKASLRQLAAEFCDDDSWVEQAFEVFYQARQQVEFYADVEPVLNSLKQNYLLASMTNGNADISATSLGHLFDYVLTAESSGAAKPDLAIFNRLIDSSALAADQILFVGDHPLDDIEGSKAAGMHSIWLNRQSIGWPEQTLQPDHSLQTLFEILPLLGAERI
ncbi:MAG: HAD family hydrolase [Gammaproteobacteria bacterium]|nr:HAD family hydrolase [Gammaproteobacteria bacterium]